MLDINYPYHFLSYLSKTAEIFPNIHMRHNFSRLQLAYSYSLEKLARVVDVVAMECYERLLQSDNLLELPGLAIYFSFIVKYFATYSQYFCVKCCFYIVQKLPS